MDQTALRKVMGQFATGVTVITTAWSEGKYGFTANSYTSVSLDPPMVLFCLSKNSEGCDCFEQSGCFAVNFLAKHQEDISNRFANYRLDAEARFENLSMKTDVTGAPILQDSLGWIDCELDKTIDGGDHWIYIGAVKSASSNAKHANPLLYFQGKYRNIDQNL